MQDRAVAGRYCDVDEPEAAASCPDFGVGQQCVPLWGAAVPKTSAFVRPHRDPSDG
jgi:hypothetical protein